jgi:hypothetical protein
MGAVLLPPQPVAAIAVTIAITAIFKKDFFIFKIHFKFIARQSSAGRFYEG